MKKLFLLFIVLIIIVPGWLLFWEKGDNKNYIKGEVLVSFNEGTKYKEAKNIFSSFGITNYNLTYRSVANNDIDDNRILRSIDSFILRVNPGKEDYFVAKLLKEPIVRSASKNYVVKFDNR